MGRQWLYNPFVERYVLDELKQLRQENYREEALSDKAIEPLSEYVPFREYMGI